MTDRGVNAVICSNKCCAPILPFYSMSNKAFLDVIIGKRKLPCKNVIENVIKKEIAKSVTFAQNRSTMNVCQIN